MEEMQTQKLGTSVPSVTDQFEVRWHDTRCWVQRGLQHDVSVTDTF